tara:strand:- start:117 stop:1322 length:1206 start_codon:yes stop_codon:yes gene_type:complete
MNIKVNDKSIYSCNICLKNYSSKSSLCNHNKKFHDNTNIIPNNTLITNDNTFIIPNIKNYNCKFCSKIFNNVKTRWAHEKKCKIKSNEIAKLDAENKQKELEFKKIELEFKKEESKILQLKLGLENSNKIDTSLGFKLNYPINNHLIDIIVDKSNSIIDLKNKNNELQLSTSLKINIISRNEDNFINVLQLCKNYDKQFNDWFILNETQYLINEITSENNSLQLVKAEHENIWIHPDLAIQLAQWISPFVGFKVSNWIRISGSEFKNINKENDLKDQKIELLENTYIKQQKRKNYPMENLIYLITTEDNKKKRIYIIGKAKNLKKRLTTYNKTTEHEVIYYKNCACEKDMTAVETLVLKTLNIYREKANRDRFILPIEKDISLFTNIIDSCINLFSNFKII